MASTIFFDDYNEYLIFLYTRIESVHEYLINAINIYQRINHR